MIASIESLYQTFLKHPKISTDSRKITEGSMFFALKGPNFNGNEYASDAINKGAAFAVIDEKDYQDDERFILVDNVLDMMQKLSQHHRLLLDIPVIGITGSNGKTTTKELINAVLSKQYRVFATQGNLNNHIGVPLSLLSIDHNHEIAIIEMGSNGKGEIEFLCSLCVPDIAVITSIGKAHLEGFGNIQGVITEKTALYKSVASRAKTIFYNKDSANLTNNLPIETENISYSNTGGILFHYESVSSFPNIMGNCIRGSQEIILKSKMYGEYNVYNIMCALSIGNYFDIDIEECVSAINVYTPKNNRSEIQTYKGSNVFLDAYNANPSSVSLVLNEYSSLKGEKILILGDMLELGSEELNEHSAILNQIDVKKFETVILFGTLYNSFRDRFPSFHFFTEFEALKGFVNNIHLNGKTLLLKGSRGMGLERLLK